MKRNDSKIEEVVQLIKDEYSSERDLSESMDCNKYAEETSDYEYGRKSKSNWKGYIQSVIMMAEWLALLIVSFLALKYLTASLS